MARVRLFTQCCAFCLASCALAQQPRPAPDQLMDRVIARVQQDERNEKDGNELVANEHLSVDELKEDGSVKEHNEFQRQPVLIDGKVFMRTVSRNGQPLTGKYLKQEQERERKFRQQLRKDKKDDDDLKLDKDLLSRFVIQPDGEESVSGRPAWVVRFTPKPGDKPERNRIERIVNHVGGRVWIDQKDYEISKVDMSLAEPVSFYAFVGRLRKLNFKIEQVEHDGLWAPAHINIDLEARAVVVSFRQRSASEFSDYRLRNTLH